MTKNIMSTIFRKVSLALPKFPSHFLLCFSFVFAFTATDAFSSSLRQDSVKTMMVSGKLRTTFYVYAPASENYNIRFWVMGVGNYNGTNSTYEVGLDDRTVGYIQPRVADWCMSTPYNVGSISITEGEHQIYLESFFPDVPNAESVESYNILNPNILPGVSPDSCYQNMKLHFEIPNQSFSGDALSENYRQISYHPIERETLSPPFHYTAELNKKVYYTFRRLEYYEMGSTISVSTQVSGSLSRVVHIFSRDNTAISTTSPVMTSGFETYTCTIPQTGFYYVMVRSSNPDEWGTCDVIINNARIFENVPVNCSRTAIEYPAANKDYACFAMCRKGDPMVFLMSPGDGGGIVRWNDDFTSANTAFDWQNSARVDGQLSTGQWVFTLTNSYPTARLKKCDIYARCEKSLYSDPFFPEYKLDDYILSSDTTSIYNCLSWAVGEWTYGYWGDLNMDGNQYVDSVLNAYYFTTTTESNSVVDLWAETGPTYTHLSVKSKSNVYAAGYDWESKLADMERVFHPRYALSNDNGWGNVIRYYKRTPPPIIHDSIPQPFLLNVNLTQDEFSLIEGGTRAISQETSRAFSELYEECKAKGLYKVTIFIDSYEKVDIYRQLLEYCKGRAELRYHIFHKICEGEILAVKLLKDLTLSGGSAHLWKEAVDNVKQLCGEQKDGKCLHSAQAYGLYLVKLLLAGGDARPFCAESFTYSNSPMLQVKASGRDLLVSFELDSDAIVSAYAGSTDGVFINRIIDNRRLEKGQCSFVYKVPKPGSYAVCLKVNGATYKKTFVVK